MSTNVTKTSGPPWLLFMFSLSANHASQRVDLWRRLRRYGAVALKNSGYVLPNMAPNEERLQWLAREVRKRKGQATIVQAQSFDGLPSTDLTRRFVEERSKEFTSLLHDLQRAVKKSLLSRAQLGRFRRRFQEIVDRDYFGSPARAKAEAFLARADENPSAATTRTVRRRSEYRARTWATRHRPGIDRVASAWLIRRWIDPESVFVFADDPKQFPKAVPFDMFSEHGFGHRGEDCTFETLVKEFGIADPRVSAIAQAIHDADLDDGKFGRLEGFGLDRVLTGWAHQGISDDELLRRGMEAIEGLYQGL